MKKRLSESQLQQTIKNLNVGEQTINIARGVLVKGISQATFVTSLNISKGAVSQAVNRIWATHETYNLPKGYERVTAILSEYQAFIVKKWATEAVKKMESQT